MARKAIQSWIQDLSLKVCSRLSAPCLRGCAKCTNMSKCWGFEGRGPKKMTALFYFQVRTISMIWGWLNWLGCPELNMPCRMQASTQGVWVGVGKAELAPLSSWHGLETKLDHTHLWQAMVNRKLRRPWAILAKFLLPNGPINCIGSQGDRAQECYSNKSSFSREHKEWGMSIPLIRSSTWLHKLHASEWSQKSPPLPISYLPPSPVNFPS